MSHTVKLAGQKLKFVYMDGPDRVRLVFEHGAIVIGTDEGSPISVGVESTSDDVAAELEITINATKYKIPKPTSEEGQLVDFQPENHACKICENTPDRWGFLEHGKGCYTQSEEGGGEEYVGP